MGIAHKSSSPFRRSNANRAARSSTAEPADRSSIEPAQSPCSLLLEAPAFPLESCYWRGAQVIVKARK